MKRTNMIVVSAMVLLLLSIQAMAFEETQGVEIPTLSGFPSPAMESTDKDSSVAVASYQCTSLIPTVDNNEYTCTYNFRAGHNFWGLLVEPFESQSASSVLTTINENGGNCSMLSYSNHSSWKTFNYGLPFNNFTLEPYNGYDIYCNQASTFILNGSQLPKLDLLSLPENGWLDYFSLPYGYPAYTSESFVYAANVGQQEFYCPYLIKYESGGFKIYMDGMPFNRFSLEEGVAYNLFCANAQAPVIHQISLSNTTVPFGESVVIGTNVSDDSPHYNVTFSIWLPNATQMNYIPAYYSKGLYFLEFNYTLTPGQYRAYVNVTDFQGMSAYQGIIFRVNEPCVPINDSVFGEGTSCTHVFHNGWNHFGLRVDPWEPLNASELLESLENRANNTNESCGLLISYNGTAPSLFIKGYTTDDVEISPLKGYYVSCSTPDFMLFTINGTGYNSTVISDNLTEGTNLISLPFVEFGYTSWELLYDLNIENPKLYCTTIQDQIASSTTTYFETGQVDFPVTVATTYNVTCALAQAPTVSDFTFSAGSILNGESINISVNASDDSPYFNVTFEIVLPNGAAFNYTVPKGNTSAFSITLNTTNDTVSIAQMGFAIATIGTYRVTAYGIDFQGHTTSTSQATFAVNDPSPPPTTTTGGGGSGSSGSGYTGFYSSSGSGAANTTPSEEEACEPNWSCEWSECSEDGTQTPVSCTDENNCGIDEGMPESRTCTPPKKTQESNTTEANTTTQTENTQSGFAGITGAVVAFAAKNPAGTAIALILVAAIIAGGIYLYKRPSATKKKGTKKKKETSDEKTEETKEEKTQE